MNESADDSFDALRAEQEAAWRSGNPIRLEDLLAKLSTPNTFSDDQFVDLVCNEFALREELGPPPSLGEYIARFPSLSTRLAGLIEAHQNVKSGSIESRLANERTGDTTIDLQGRAHLARTDVTGSQDTDPGATLTYCVRLENGFINLWSMARTTTMLPCL